jgi:hypothetical protein
MVPKDLMIIEVRGKHVHFGVKGQWVVWEPFEKLFSDGHRPTHKEMRAIIEYQDRLRDQ